MAEMGPEAPSEHLLPAPLGRGPGGGKILVAGPAFSAAAHSLQESHSGTAVSWYPGRDELEHALRTDSPRGYQILVKGSRVMALEKILPLLNET
ncbi:MAG: hypothetical protein R2751_13230 [Bacteroidales bacterium]